MAYIFAMKPRNRVRELRKARGMSQADLAREAGISQPAVSQIENDTRPLTIDWMRAIARILDCTPADLLDSEDNPDRLSDSERAIIERYRAGRAEERQTLERVAEAVVPFKVPAQRDAA